MEKTNEKICLCALNRIFGFEPKIGAALISHVGNASDVFLLSREDLRLILGPYSKHAGEISDDALDRSEKELERLEKNGIRFTGCTEDTYPALLKECPDYPIGLYIRSRTPDELLWKPSRSIAIVGTRDISPYGKEWCERITSGLASPGGKPLIISGLALGTDICAHRTAILHGLPTIAVMATGPEAVYPFRHKAFAEELADTEGCALVTDYPPGTPPLPIHFLRRNRIIAGLSDSVILIESRIRGGGMMTARLAFSYDRDVYALPGRIDDVRSQGCNHLIRSKVAEPISTPEELYSSLGVGIVASGCKDEAMNAVIGRYMGTSEETDSGPAGIILKLIFRNRGITIDEIAESTGLGYDRTRAIITTLEADGVICTDLMQRCSIIIRKSR